MHILKETQYVFIRKFQQICCPVTQMATFTKVSSFWQKFFRAQINKTYSWYILRPILFIVVTTLFLFLLNFLLSH